MALLASIRKWTSALIRRRTLERELDEEISFHLEMAAADNQRRGMTPVDSRRDALRRFGGVTQSKEATRAEWGILWLDDLSRDLRFGFRLLRASPIFTVAVALTLGVGIGATTTAFGVLEGILLRPLLYREPDRILTLWETDTARGESRLEVSPGNYWDWQERQRTFERVALLEPSGVDLELAPDLPPLPVKTWATTEGFFEIMGTAPLLGQLPAREHFLPNAEPVVVLSYEFWQRQLAADPEIVGKNLRLDGKPARVLAVMPRDFAYPPGGRAMWVPGAFPDYHFGVRSGTWMQSVGRLAAGATVEAARSDLRRIAAELASEHPQTNTGKGATAIPIRDAVLGSIRPILWLVFAGVALLLAVGCANVVGLMLARLAARERELALRHALGAHTRRLARQLLAETLALCVLAGLLGLALALAGLRLLVILSPPEVPRLDQVRLGAWSGGFAFLLTGVVLVLSGLLPALRGARMPPGQALERSGRTHTASRGHWRVQGVLVAGQVALASVLLVGAGLLLRSFRTLFDRPLGFAVENRLEMQVFLYDLFPKAEQRQSFLRQVRERLEALPGVGGAAAVSSLPLHPSAIDSRDDVEIHGRPLAAGSMPFAYTTVATPEYFALMEIPLLEGRRFGAADGATAPRVCVLNETMARRYWPSESPIGKRLTFGVMGPPSEWEVVGIVGSVRPGGFETEPRPEVFVPFEQLPTGSLTLVLRADRRARALLGPAQQVVWDIAPRQTIYHAATLESLLDQTLVRRRFALALLTSLALVACLMAATGVYSLISFALSQRTAELGIRKALGAKDRDLLRLGLGWAARWAGAGLVLGLLASLLATRLLRPWLVDVEPGDPYTLAAVLAVMGGVALLAAYLPSRRAASMEPMRALRLE